MRWQLFAKPLRVGMVIRKYSVNNKCVRNVDEITKFLTTYILDINEVNTLLNYLLQFLDTHIFE